MTSYKNKSRFQWGKIPLKTYILKSTLIVSACVVSIIAPLTLPIFATISLLTGSMSYMLGPFIILDLKTIITFIIES